MENIRIKKTSKRNPKNFDKEARGENRIPSTILKRLRKLQRNRGIDYQPYATYNGTTDAKYPSCDPGLMVSLWQQVTSAVTAAMGTRQQSQTVGAVTSLVRAPQTYYAGSQAVGGVTSLVRVPQPWAHRNSSQTVGAVTSLVRVPQTWAHGNSSQTVGAVTSLVRAQQTWAHGNSSQTVGAVTSLVRVPQTYYVGSQAVGGVTTLATPTV